MEIALTYPLQCNAKGYGPGSGALTGRAVGLAVITGCSSLLADLEATHMGGSLPQAVR